jgi:transglutaminase-like putative cysteine protease
MKKSLLILLIILSSCVAMAQDFPYASFTAEETNMAKYTNDTAAHAVVLAEFGKAYIITTSEYVPVIFEYHIKIKILDSKGFDKANIEIPIYKGDGEAIETVTDIKGITYYRDEKGVAQQSDLENKKIFRVNENKYWDRVKFTMPNIRVGSIIEYSYRLESPYKQNFRHWIFQSDIPKIRSEFEAHIPAIYNYNISLRGDLRLTSNKADLERECFTVNGIKCDCSKISYVMENIPAFIEEDYMTSSKNFISAINFELTDYINLGTGLKKKMSMEWADVDYAFKRNESFGSQLKHKDIFKEKLMPAVAGITDSLAKGKAVYAYIQKNIKWNGFNSVYTDEGIRKALDKHTGMVADINLALVTALNAAGIKADPVLLSTRDHGMVNKLFPIITEFNYVVARTTIGNKVYLLDATDPLLAFGLLPMRCLNDQGRVMSMDKPSYWIDMNTQQKQSSIYTLDLTLQENGKLKGTMVNFTKGYAAFEKRKAIKKFNTIDEYVENLDEKLAKVKILKANINNVDSLDMPVSETYEVEIDAFDNLNHTQLSFNPFLFDRILTNPFKLNERSYPVDWGMPSETRYILNVHLPDGYTIVNPPQTTAIAMPQQGAKFIITYEGHDNSFNFSHVTLFNKSIYEPNEYPYLKELYNKIILSEKTEMVFKKKI